MQGRNARLFGCSAALLRRSGLRLGVTFEMRPDAFPYGDCRVATNAAHETGKPEHEAGNGAAIERGGSGSFPGPVRRLFTIEILALDSDARRVAQSPHSQVRYTCRVAHINCLEEEPCCYATVSHLFTLWLPSGEGSYALELSSVTAGN